eukprot:CAMPEP_0176402910 /NCGR_PEP_ID=MMETSP0126-20121128/49668_1 /TAXON_ID=141414 ORGANISM="Strombidinopsis acuminatum, Strain SPMC142" /NCGR_SAMPLE_ID=MMETSP0126 /ASSEMBLY_ACC=CAM_ASM_000229 /LENGTH=214 /DNA_ID=CAMNT_0017780835 /DNA_START=520 /DNA_END=1164 /DNA_ORIENTATION=+
MYTLAENKRKPDGLKSVRFGCIQVTKGAAMVCTVYGILAVDFPAAYPRALAKTEQYGLSVMDFGVAYVTLNSGYASRYARPWLTDRPSMCKELIATIKGCAVPALLGVGRFWAVGALDYQKHASEYGVHWNFFTTVACTSLMLCFLRDSKYAFFVAVVVLTLYEFCLQTWGLTDYILYAPRKDFISANREGIFSLCGYFSMLMIGLSQGRMLNE